MSLRLPEHLRIGHIRYVVYRSQEMSDKQSVRDRSSLAGHSAMTTQTIVLAETDGNGDPLGPDYLRDTLIHEVLHSCLRVSACDPDADAKAGLPDVEERAVAAISGPLLAALRDNPDLVDYLMDGVS